MADPRPRGPQQGRRAAASRPSVDPARLAALDVLKAVRVDGAYTNLVLPAVIRHHGLTGRDAAFVTELASGTIRRRGTYDAIIAACADRPLNKIEAKVLDALRLGTHQLLSMRVPSHAAISTTVDLVRAKVSSGAGGFANAVLRRVDEQGLAEWIGRVAPDPRVAPTRFASIAYSHPRWVVDELRSAVGADELYDLLAADNEPPLVTLVARPGRSTREELPGEPTPYSPYGVILQGGDPGEVAAVSEGRAGVQDEGSQLVAVALAAAEVEGRDELWLDLCAGPGGKAALLAGLAAQQGAGLVAAERQPHRAKLVQRSLKGAAGVAGLVASDGTAPPFLPGTFDRVLVDAPCTGLGALRRRPEARWRRRPDDLLSLVLLQRRLLSAALDLTRPGGVVLYATCSPVISETKGVVASVLDTRRDVRLEDLGPLLPGVPDCAGPVPGTVQLWPHRHGTDAMFMALLRRV
ncbi:MULTISPECIES: RsmB/NOP family class I SAM-dependent RNA methyltransferase [unclassified Nocardioides]|uniref:RsmB/NOP family class I SAM-dependent RNA methyltransferase n=1 Tax=unclassified Nocardioides TaxID=2615069 RepID=UPI0009F0887E|nr:MULTISPECIES: transcription antitermination factor NusB [unclassified Nocardioides]GAW49510.1 Fmu (Sun) domain-containing protein [Nocardioides sp. PD653-B2]GAW54976.1 Fmu (Sun) domain-containing protein [Nocardioides sp. PD653]